MCLSELNIAASHFPRSSVTSCSFWERNVLFGKMKMSQKKKMPAAPGVYLAHFWEGLDILEIADQSTSNPIGWGRPDDLILIFHLWLLAWQWSTMLFPKDCPFGLIDAGFQFHSVLPSMSPLSLSSFYSWKQNLLVSWEGLKSSYHWELSKFLIPSW